MPPSAFPSLDRDLFASGFLTLIGPLADEADDEFFSEDTVVEIGTELFGEAPELIDAFVARFTALLPLLDLPDAGPWCYESPEGDVFRVHPALLSAAAEVRLNDNGKFPRRLFFDRVDTLAATDFPGWDWDDPDPTEEDR